jgi:hypothetical protein
MINQLKILAVVILTFTFTIIFTGCDENSGKDNTKQLLPLLLLGRCNGTKETFDVGDTGPGCGIVFYVTDGGLHGLEAAPSDQSTGSAWSTITDAFANGISALPREIGTGSANTDTIISQNGGAASAAKICRDYTGGGKTDWFLPSRDELQQLYAGQTNVGGFFDNYWSSTEASVNNMAIYVGFSSGVTGGSSKGDSFRVRAIRAF